MKNNNLDYKFLEERDKLIKLYEKYGNLLSQSQKQVFHLHYVEDLSLTEIAQVIVTSRQAISDALNKARAKLLDIDKKCL